VAKLEAGGRALDVGCGSGRVCTTLAQAFPRADIVGVDPDEASIRRAQAASSKAKFLVATASSVERGAGFDLITLCDCLHDLAQPVATLQEVKRLLKPDGTLFIVEPKAADALQENLNPVATMFYGFSIFHCMTQSLARGGPGLGTCMGPRQTDKLLREAGFGRVEVLPIKSQVSLFYAARP
jgi:ubiquinone/menaquinone biosynthesis C-methylase UbiE